MSTIQKLNKHEGFLYLFQAGVNDDMQEEFTE
jgi:hypothetical protein